MLESLLINKNKLIDWFIPDRTKINFPELHVKRRFVEAVMIIFIASLSGFLMKVSGFRVITHQLGFVSLKTCQSIN
jgi:hypothetical protein